MFTVDQMLIILNYLAREQFICYHGERTVQLNPDRQIDQEPKISIWFKAASCCCFFTPHIYINRLNKIWSAHGINYPKWRKFILELQDDWAASITPVEFTKFFWSLPELRHFSSKVNSDSVCQCGLSGDSKCGSRHWKDNCRQNRRANCQLHVNIAKHCKHCLLHSPCPAAQVKYA